MEGQEGEKRGRKGQGEGREGGKEGEGKGQGRGIPSEGYPLRMKILSTAMCRIKYTGVPSLFCRAHAMLERELAMRRVRLFVCLSVYLYVTRWY